jgi:lipoate-protein ligase A
MYTFLRVPSAKTCMEVVGVAKHKITSIDDELGKDVSVAEVSSALVEGFQKALNVKLTGGKLTAYERGLAKKLCKVKYEIDDWNLHGASPLQ